MPLCEDEVLAAPPLSLGSSLALMDCIDALAGKETRRCFIVRCCWFGWGAGAMGVLEAVVGDDEFCWGPPPYIIFAVVSCTLRRPRCSCVST